MEYYERWRNYRKEKTYGKEIFHLKKTQPRSREIRREIKKHTIWNLNARRVRLISHVELHLNNKEVSIKRLREQLAILMTQPERF